MSKESLLDKTIEQSPRRRRKSVEEFGAEVFIPDNGSFCYKQFKIMGPGILMSMAYIDPGNIAGDLEAGVDAKQSLLWILLIATILGGIFQCVAVKSGIVTGMDLAQNCYVQYNKPSRQFLCVMTLIAIIGADVQEVIGSSIALNILFGLPIWAGALITIVDTFLFMFLQQAGIRKLEIFFGIFLIGMFFCFLINLIIFKPPITDILYGTFIPTIPPNSKDAMIGLIGSVIMPHNFQLHSALVNTRIINKSSKKLINSTCQLYYFDTFVTLSVSFLINLTIISTFAYYSGKESLTLLNAGDAFSENFGNFAKIIWGIGLLSSGQASTMTGAYAGQYVLQGFLQLNISPFKRVLIFRSVAIIPALMVTFISTPDKMDESLNILQALQLPFAILPLLIFSSNKIIMKNMEINKQVTIFLIFISLCLVGTNIYGLIPLNKAYYYQIIFIISLIFYFIVFIVIALQKIKIKQTRESKLFILEHSHNIFNIKDSFLNLKEDDKKSVNKKINYDDSEINNDTKIYSNKLTDESSLDNSLLNK